MAVEARNVGQNNNFSRKLNVWLKLDFNIDLRASGLWSGIINMFQSEFFCVTKFLKTKKSQDLRPGSDFEKSFKGSTQDGGGGYGRLDGSLARERLKQRYLITR